MKCKIDKCQAKLPNLYVVGMVFLSQWGKYIVLLIMLPKGLKNKEDEVLLFVLLNNVTISKSDWLGEP